MGGISHNEDAFFSKVYCCLILNYPTPIEIWIWKLVVRALPLKLVTTWEKQYKQMMANLLQVAKFQLRMKQLSSVLLRSSCIMDYITLLARIMGSVKNEHTAAISESYQP